MNMYRNIFCVVALLLTMVAAEVAGQSRYCNSYEEYVVGQWTPLDTLYGNHGDRFLIPPAINVAISR